MRLGPDPGLRRHVGLELAGVDDHEIDSAQDPPGRLRRQGMGLVDERGAPASGKELPKERERRQHDRRPRVDDQPAPPQRQPADDCDRQRRGCQAAPEAEGGHRRVASQRRGKDPDPEARANSEVVPDRRTVDRVRVSHPQGDERYPEASSRKRLTRAHPRDWLDPGLAHVARREEEEVAGPLAAL